MVAPHYVCIPFLRAVVCFLSGTVCMDVGIYEKCLLIADGRSKIAHAVVQTKCETLS